MFLIRHITGKTSVDGAEAPSQNSFSPNFPKFSSSYCTSSHFSTFCISPQYSVSYVETLHCGLLQDLIFDIVTMSLVLFCFGLLLFFGILYGLAASIFYSLGLWSWSWVLVLVLVLGLGLGLGLGSWSWSWVFSNPYP